MTTSLPHSQPRNPPRSLASLQLRTKRLIGTTALCLGWIGSSVTSHALIFNFVPAAGTSQAAIDGFAAAGTRWSTLFTDNVTINVNIAFTALGSGILGSTNSTQGTVSYTGVRNSLMADAKSAADAIAVANLQSGPALSLLINRTSDDPFGPGSSTPYLDSSGANNTTIRMTTANAKALGLLAGNNAGMDADISFSTAFSWDFDPTNGITAGAFDFVGIATHEIGHALGFYSGVDILDGNSSGPFFTDNQFTYVSTLDLFRHSAQSGAAIDWTDSASDKFFSIDGGVTLGPKFSDGINHGDGNQASHWKDNLGLGIMDPTAAPGELLSISANDITAFDVIGWDRAPAAPAPDETSSCVLVGVGLAAMAFLRRRMKASASSA